MLKRFVMSSFSRNFATSVAKLSPEAQAAAYRIREMEEKLVDNEYFGKYKAQFESLKSSDPVEYLRRLDKLASVTESLAQMKAQEIAENNSAAGDLNDKIGNLSVNGAESEKVEGGEAQAKSEEELEAAATGNAKAPTGLPYDLNKLLKVDLMKDKTKDEVANIWKQYFSTHNSICAIIPKKKFTQISTLATVCPQFIYPVPRDEGYEMYLGQWQDNMMFFTSLVYYHKHGEHAPPQLSMHHYPNLQESHGIVLMASRIDTNQISVQDAQFLAYLVELFYGTDDGELVRKFRYQPETFSHEMVIEKIEKMIENSMARPPIPDQSKGTVERKKKGKKAAKAKK